MCCAMLVGGPGATQFWLAFGSHWTELDQLRAVGQFRIEFGQIRADFGQIGPDFGQVAPTSA